MNIYTYETQQKALSHLIENTPHDMNAFEKLYNVQSESGKKPKIDIDKIIFSTVWSADEKITLVNLYGYNTKVLSYSFMMENISYYDMNLNYGRKRSSNYTNWLTPIDSCILNMNKTGLEALLKLGVPISLATIPLIIEQIEDPIDRYEYCKLIVKYRNQRDMEVYSNIYVNSGIKTVIIPSLVDVFPFYEKSYFGDKLEFRGLVTSMKEVIKTQDLELIELFIPTIVDATPLLDYAIKFGTPEIARLFIKKGADVNYQEKKYMLDSNCAAIKTAIKTAIDNNDLQMIRFLYRNGADINFVDRSPEILEFIRRNKKGTSVSGCRAEYHADWSYSPLEYAINVGPSSISKIFSTQTNYDIAPHRNNVDQIDRVKDRAKIVRYLYEIGAKFTDGNINYTDLISFAVLAKDPALTSFFLSEAKLHNYPVDFKKIMKFIYERNVYMRHDVCLDEKDIISIIDLLNSYSKEMNIENHPYNAVELMKIVLRQINGNSYKADVYKKIMVKISSDIPDELKKEIPAIFNCDFTNINFVLNMGYDLNTIENDRTFLMKTLTYSLRTEELIERLIDLGVDVNYISPKTGKSALSVGLENFPLIRFKDDPNVLEHRKILSLILRNSSDEVVQSEEVSKVISNTMYCENMVIYKDIFEELGRRGTKISNESFTRALGSLILGSSICGSEHLIDEDTLSMLYASFNNDIVGNNLHIPSNVIVNAADNEKSFELLKTHLFRNFITSESQIEDPLELMPSVYNPIKGITEDRNKLELAKQYLSREIFSFIGILSTEQIEELIDSCPIIDVNALFITSPNGKCQSLLSTALSKGKFDEANMLIRKGASLVYHNGEGIDITRKIFSDKLITMYSNICKEYNPNKELDELLGEICNESPTDSLDKPKCKSKVKKTVNE